MDNGRGKRSCRVERGDPTSMLTKARLDPGAFLGDLLDGYRSYLHLLSRGALTPELRTKVDASDVVQETMLRATDRFAQFRGKTEAELTAWLRSILASRLAKLVRAYFRTRRRDVRLERELARELDRSSQALDRSLVLAQSSPSQRASRKEQAVLLADAIEELPPDHREVIVLRHLEGLTFPEVARRMDRSVGSVEKLWVRALPRLRKAMGGGA